jgi:hypothetical protein
VAAALVVSAGLAAGTAHAAQFDAGVSLTIQSDPDATVTGIFGTYYLEGLSDDANPLDLQVFHQMAPWAGVNLATNNDADASGLAASGEIYVMPKLSILPVLRFGDLYSDWWFVGVYYYFMPQLKIGLRDAVGGYFDSALGDFIDGDCMLNWVDVETVFEVAQKPLHIAGAVSLDGFADVIGASATLFLEKDLGVGADLVLTNGDDTIGVHAAKWFGRLRAAASISISGDMSSLMVSATGRF